MNNLLILRKTFSLKQSFQMDAKFLRNLRFSKKNNLSREDAEKKALENKDKKRKSIKL